MATVVLTNAFVSLSANDLSDHVQSVTLNYEAESLDVTAMSNTTRVKKGGLYNWSGSVTFFADEASTEPSAAIFAFIGTTGTIIIRPTASAVSATNPNYTGTALYVSNDPLSGSVGEMQMTTLNFESAGALSRATS